MSWEHEQQVSPPPGAQRESEHTPPSDGRVLPWSKECQQRNTGVVLSVQAVLKQARRQGQLVQRTLEEVERQATLFQGWQARTAQECEEAVEAVEQLQHVLHECEALFDEGMGLPSPLSWLYLRLLSPVYRTQQQSDEACMHLVAYSEVSTSCKVEDLRLRKAVRYYLGTLLKEGKKAAQHLLTLDEQVQPFIHEPGRKSR